MAYVDTETLRRNIRVNFMPNVDIDGTVTVENAERYFLNLIEKTSTADVVEVVRCKDCKYFHKDFCGQMWCRKKSDGLGINEDHIVDKNHYCGYGKRKE